VRRSPWSGFTVMPPPCTPIFDTVGQRDAAKLENWNAYLDTIDLEFLPPVPHTVINNSASVVPLQTQARKLLASIVDASAS
jgi:hypothetical protein